jgi:hypothetical protein
MFSHTEWGSNLLADAAEGVVDTLATTVEALVTMGKEIGDGIFKGWKTVQYDLIKNIYRSSYDGSLAMYSPFWGFFDGEKNLCFSMYNKTPWDAMQIAAQNAPEYLGMPLYHQFESRMFLGLPYFLAKYRYDKINGEIFEEAKTFAQVHFIDSLSEIIDNQMLTTSRDIYTNAIVMYIRGKSPHATPTLYSDKSISFSYQSTKIFDSSVSQNLIGPDALWEFLGADMGKEGACRVGISQLLYNWEKAYQGDVLLLGDAGINPCDYLYINDRFNSLTGLCTARTVSHKLSSSTGFITIVTPGMIGLSTMQNSQAQVVLSNIITVGGAFSYYMAVKQAIKENAEQVAEWYNTCKAIVAVAGIAQGVERTILVSSAFYKTVNSTKNLYKLVKLTDYAALGKELKTFGGAIRTSITGAKLLKSADKIGDSVKIGKALLTAGKVLMAGGTKALGAEIGSVVPGLGTLIGFAVGLVIDILLSAVIDYFRWNNCVVLMPMTHKGNPYAPITSGEKLLLTGSSNTSNDTISEELEAGDPGEETFVSEDVEE